MGDMSSIGNILLNILFGGTAATITQFLFSYFGEKKKNALDLIARFDSREMYESRTSAWELIRKYPDITFENDIVYDDPKADDLWVLLGFYKVVSIMLNENRVDKKLVRDALGQVFIHWYYASFKAQLIPVHNRWDMILPIRDLHDWLEGYVERDKFQQWRAEGEAERAKHLREAAAVVKKLPTQPRYVLETGHDLTAVQKE